MIHILNINKYKGHYMVNIEGDFNDYIVNGEDPDYDEETAHRMKAVAKSIYNYPFFVHFEMSEDDILDVINTPFCHVEYENSGRTFTRLSSKGLQVVSVPSFTVQIDNEAMLEQVFEEWFYVACQNELWAISQRKATHFEDGFKTLQFTNSDIILIASHDAQGFHVLVDKNVTKENVLYLVEKAL